MTRGEGRRHLTVGAEEPERATIAFLVYLCPFCVASRALGDRPLPGAPSPAPRPVIGEAPATVFSY